MPDAPAPPFWAAPALLAAVEAALGFVGKTVVDLVLRLREAARERKSRLIELYAVLRAGDVAFAVQRELLERLAVRLRDRLPETANLQPGFDRLFAATYAGMNDEERQLHMLIRTPSEPVSSRVAPCGPLLSCSSAVPHSLGKPCSLPCSVGGAPDPLGCEIRSMDHP